MQHFGIYRDVTLEQARLDKLALKTLFRWGSMQSSVLSNRCQTKVSNPAWPESLARLMSYGLVELFDRRGTSYIRLTESGNGWGLDITCEAAEILDAPIPGSQREADRKAREAK